jgi:hypothetical protein
MMPRKVIKDYQSYKAIIKKREVFYQYKELHPKLYNDNKDKHRTVEVVLFRSKELASINTDQIYQENAEQMNLVNVGPFYDEDVKVEESNHLSGRNVESANVNSIFRLLIWEDMMTELWRGKKIFGVGLGHPQRSKNIEILNWAPSEWKRDGWITPHNSFIHIMYRAGLLGIGLIVILFFILFSLIKDFIAKSSLSGILLTGIIIYGLVAANFLLILELPYYAIPFWCIFGLTLAYKRELYSQKNRTV